MSIDWDGYEVYDPGVDRPLDQLSRREARAAFKKLMAEKPERIEQLRKLLAANEVRLGDDAASILELGDWFRRNVEADPRDPERLLPRWYSVVNDIALFLGEVAIGRCPNLRWVMYEWGKRNISYQRHVIMGFTKVSNPKYNADIDMAVAVYGHRIIAGREVEPDRFLSIIKSLEDKA